MKMNNQLTVTITVNGTTEVITTVAYERVAAMTPHDFGDEVLSEIGDEIPRETGAWKLVLVDGNEKHTEVFAVANTTKIESKIADPLYELLDSYRA